MGAFVATLAVVGVLSVGAGKAEAFTRTASVTGSWSDTLTWGGNAIPTSADDVVINSGITVTVDVTAVANTVTYNNTNSTINLGSNSLTVTGAVALNTPSGNGTNTLNIGTGALSAASVSASGASSKISVITGTTGTITTAGGITFGGAVTTNGQLTLSGAGSITLGGTTGTIGTGGTVSLGGSSTVNFAGSGAQTVNVYTYGNLTKSGSGTATMATGTIPVAGNLSVTAGTLDMAASVPTISGTTTVASGGTLSFSSATGLKTFTGNVTVNSGGTWTESAAVAVTYAGNLANSGTFTASSGVHTFGTGAISGTVSIPSLTGTAITNNGTLTVSTTLAGTLLTNSASGVLNIGGTSSGLTTLTATASGNVVNYTGTALTVKATSYYDLNLTGSGTYVFGSAVTVSHNLAIVSGVGVNLTGSSTAGYMDLGGIHKSAGTYGFTGSGATYIDTTYFPGAGTGIITVAAKHSSSSTTTTTGGSGSSSTTTTTTTTTTSTPPTTEVVTCAQGQLFSVVSGKACTTFTTSSDITCPTGGVYDVATGKKCTIWAQASVTTNTANGSVTTTVTISKSVGKGSPKSEIMKLQAALNKALKIALKEDGIWGGKTMAAIKQFQAQAKLSADGKVGPMTSAALNAAVSAN